MPKLKPDPLGSMRSALLSTREGPKQLCPLVIFLPLENKDGRPGEDYFADGLTGALTTELSRLKDIDVIGWSSAVSFKKAGVGIDEVCRELGVRFVLQGSVQRDADYIRISIQLLDASTGDFLWAERFERHLIDLFELKDQIVSRLALILELQLIATDLRRTGQKPKPDSLDLWFQGVIWINKGIEVDNLVRAHNLYQRALKLDAFHLDALVGVSYIQVAAVASFNVEDGAARLLSAESALKGALMLADKHAFAHFVLGLLCIYSNRPKEGITKCMRALDLDRNLAQAHAVIGIAKNTIGHFDETEAHIREALRLSPRDTFAHTWLLTAAFATLCLGRYQRARILLQEAITAKQNYAPSYFYFAACLAYLERFDEARNAIEEGLLLAPGFTLERFRASAPSNNPSYLTGREHIIDGMRKAGVPTELKSKPAKLAHKDRDAR